MTDERRCTPSTVCSVVAALLASTIAAAAMAGPTPLLQEEDIDVFMQKVLQRRVTNWEDLYRYTVRDRESFEVKGPSAVALGSYRGEYTWYVRDGYMVRSPDRIDGHAVSDTERQKFERDWLRRAREREQKRQEQRQERAAEAAESGAERPLERDYFLGFPFEPGNYYVAGWEDLEGMSLVKIEYYPKKLFEDEDEDEDEDQPDPEDIEWARRFQKTSVVTMWVLPEEHQIIKIGYDNIGLDFMPLRWLVQVGDIGAEMIMHKPFPEMDVWLPREIRASGEATFANGSYDVRYSLEYHDYRETEVDAKVRFGIPGLAQQND
ncbi:MAG TPA: hypothetical protein QGG47_02470 [Acidobacteriota bacterium]|nr:hypothetical protein [Acidobacteriota bacterium]